MTTQVPAGRPLGDQVRETHALGATQLVVAVLASVVGTVLTGFFGAGRLGTLAGAAVGPLVSAVFTTHGRGTARTVGIGLLTALALVVTVGGFTVSDLLRDGESPVANREGTFLPPPGTGSDPPALAAPEEVRCPDTAVGSTSDCRFGVKPAGSAAIRLDGAELDGRHQDDFTITKECKGTLKPGTACSIRLKFTPSDEGERRAEVMVKVASGTRSVELRGNGVAATGGDCLDGFVPRAATAGDNVCVTEAEHRRALRQNQDHQEEQRANPDGTCVQGFVWREATPGDVVCVTTAEREEAAQQNAQHADRSAN